MNLDVTVIFLPESPLNWPPLNILSSPEATLQTSKAMGLMTIAFFSVVLPLLVITWYMKKHANGRSYLGRLPPGPRGLPLVGSLPFLDPNLHHHFTSLASSYGPIFSLRLGRKLFVVVNSSSLAREVLKDQDLILANRDVPATALHIFDANHGMGWAPYGDKWRMLRKLSVREFLNGAKQASFHDLRRRKVHRMLRRVAANVGTPAHIFELVLDTSFEVMTHMLWGGEDFTTEGGAGVQAEFRQAMEEFNAVLMKPNLKDFFPALGGLGMMSVDKEAKAVAAKFERLLNVIIAGRRKAKDDGESNDFLMCLLRIQERVDPKLPLTTANIISLLMDLVTAGIDTTSTTMEWAMTEMLRYGEIMKRVQEELDQVVGQANLVQEWHLPELHYLDAVLKEVMRLLPAAPLLLPRAASRPCVVGGYLIPMEARVMVNAWAIQRDPETWEDPDEFRPERFLRLGSGDWSQSGKEFNYLPFGSGRRICPGITVADTLLKYMFASLLHSFDWKLPEGNEVDRSDKFGIGLRKAVPLMVIPTPRQPNNVDMLASLY